MTLRIPTSLLLLFIGQFCFAQKAELVYQPKNMDSIQKYIGNITLKKIKSFEGQYEKDIQKTLNERKDAFIKTIKDSNYIFDSRINNYFKNILAEIYRANPDIDHQDFYFFVDKSPVPNAACYGNGIFTVNLGLFNVLDTDDEIAFTICHEIAHYKLKHTDKSLLEYISKANSKQTKQDLKKASKQDYGATRAVMEVLKTINYNFLKRSRLAETEADSLGYVFLSKTRFNKAAGYVSLKKLGECDTILFKADTKLREHFTFDDYPFNEAWLERDAAIFDLKEARDDFAFNKDSLKTHPDIPLRLKKLESLYSGKDGIAPTPALDAVRKIVVESSIAASMDDSDIDMALYQILTMYTRKEIDEKTYAKNVAYLLRRTYELKQAHNFGKYVGPVTTFSEEKYLDEVKLFLNHLELKQTRKIGHRFCQKHQALMKGDAEFAATAEFFAKLNTN